MLLHLQPAANSSCPGTRPCIIKKALKKLSQLTQHYDSRDTLVTFLGRGEIMSSRK